MESKGLPYPTKTSHILSRVIKFPDIENNDIDVILSRVKNMVIGDRTYLMFLLRQSTFGDSVYFDVKCSSCNDTMSISLSISQMMGQLLSSQNKSDLMMDIETGYYQVKFSNCVAELRLLKGLDQENISLLPINETNLVQSCITNIDAIGREKLLDNDFLNFIDSNLSRLDPLSDIVLTQNCPSCNASCKIPLIIEDFFFKEVKARKDNLEFEVHWLALNYHWSESEILTLPISKRRRYVELVSNTLGAEVNNG